MVLRLILTLADDGGGRLRLVCGAKFLQILDLVVDVIQSYGLQKWTVLLNNLCGLSCNPSRLFDEVLVLPAVYFRLLTQ